ncbi:hypothetical protein C7121_11665 [Paenibacillus glucanolyticus]|jgi:hypothetical protein|uniref:hypothetical protein n=1 Tax=Paenibacillus TaxID=44249 RepID=UPI0003E1D226|nr:MULTISPECIES: hypothetical protein [Paenibacillus]ANA79329.1 hypothetical protein A3958_04660 [Paenibacillus glucanolyticus]AVV56728.1 hypothetical protein C7121_11665 [Paenibacillus glucanolyticus]ETT29728.1 hypothetical protein C169_28862 [Paenibacillus sp. FSL R5-808]MPY18680.1 hypothetical protein [Paenibacillus glucanolyticus]
MRGAVRQAVVGIIPELEGRVYDVYPPDGAVEPLFAAITLGEDVWKSSWAGYRQVVRLKLYANPTELLQLDRWANQLIPGLHRKRVTGADGNSFKLHYLGVPEADKFDPSTGKMIRIMRFGVYVPELSGAGFTGQPDEWLSALAAWTGDVLGNSWSIYHTAWPAGRDDCAMLWRMTGCETRMAGASMVEVRKTFTGHIAALDSGSEQLTTVRLVEELGTQVQLLLDSQNRRYASVVEIASDMQADPILDGQLKLTLAQRKLRSPEEAALIRRVNIQPILK